MEQDKLQKGIKEIKNIKMTPLEKKDIFESILKSSPTQSEKPVVSPYSIFSFFAVINKKRLIYSASVFCLVIMLGGGAVFASGGSLPGSILYPLKVKVVEPATGAFIFSPIAKIEYENNLATKRLIEAEILASEDKLDSAKEDELNSLLEVHTIAFNKAVDDFYKNRKPEEDLADSDEVINNFQVKMNAHAKILDILKRDRENTGEDLETKISRTAKENAKKAKDMQKKREIERKPTDENKYKERKDSVRLLIDKTVSDLNNSGTANSKRRQSVVESATKSLEDAKKLLQESDENETKGDSQNALDKLLDSENSAKEVNVFLQTGLGL